MADRTSAGIFGEILGMLAKNPTDEHKVMARKVFDMSQCYDFGNCQMDADDACLALGIAREGVNSEYPEEGIVVLWPRDAGYEDAVASNEERKMSWEQMGWKVRERVLNRVTMIVCAIIVMPAIVATPIAVVLVALQFAALIVWVTVRVAGNF